MYKNSSTLSSNQSNAVYDSAGMRVATQVDNVWTFFIYDISGNKVAEYGGLQTNDGGGVKYILSDHQGSSRATVNNAGYVNSRTDYTAFGEEIQSNIGQRTAQGYASSNNLDQKYAQTERDKATGLNHTWYRKHENQAGRWTSPDPYNGSMNIGDPQSFNRYSYVNNQPTNYVDPSGLLMAVCTSYRQTWQSLNEHGDIIDNIREWTECQIFGGGGSPGTGITPRDPIGRGGSIGGDRTSVRESLSNHLDNLSTKCQDALKALKLTKEKLLSAFDNATFKSDPNKKEGSADTSYKTGKGATNAITITTKSGNVDDFADSLGFLIHELSHGAAKKNDRGIYNALVKGGVSINLVTKTVDIKNRKGKVIEQKEVNDYSQTLSDFFNDNCN